MYHHPPPFPTCTSIVFHDSTKFSKASAPGWRSPTHTPDSTFRLEVASSRSRSHCIASAYRGKSQDGSPFDQFSMLSLHKNIDCTPTTDGMCAGRKCRHNCFRLRIAELMMLVGLASPFLPQTRSPSAWKADIRGSLMGLRGSACNTVDVHGSLNTLWRQSRYGSGIWQSSLG